MLQAWFHRLHSVFTQRRVDWLTNLIRQELLGTLPEEIKAAAELKASEEYVAVESAVKKLNSLVEQLGA